MPTLETFHLLECLKIAHKYGIDVAADHDIVYFCGPNPNLDCEDTRALQAYGAFYDETYDSWALFV